MKMKFRGVSLAAALLSARMIFAPGAAIGQEAGGSVGDLPGYRHLPTTFVGDDNEVEWEADEAEPMSDDSPISYSDLHPSATEQIVSGYPSRSVSRRGQRRGGLMNRAEDAWLSAELLLWFPQQRRTPPLVVTAPAGVQPVIGDGGQTAFGGDVGGGLTPGFRIDAGRYLSENFGIGGRFWFLGENSESFSASGNGTGPSIGRPFYDVSIPGNRSILVNLGNQVFRGEVSVESELDLIAAEAYGRLKFGRGSNYHVDLLGGYSFFGIDDRLSARSTTTDDVNSGDLGGTPGQATTFHDEFDAENRFHGGQLGMEMSLTQGRWMLTSLTKVHLGNMNQSIGIRGSGTVDPDGPGGDDPAEHSFGALALETQGDKERDRFAFAPEVNLKLAYRFRPHVLLSVGYSLIYFDNVLLAGDHIDPLFDAGNGAPPNGGPFNQRDFQFRDSSLWVQGIDLGFVLDF